MVNLVKYVFVCVCVFYLNIHILFSDLIQSLEHLKSLLVWDPQPFSEWFTIFPMITIYKVCKCMSVLKSVQILIVV